MQNEIGVIIPEAFKVQYLMSGCSFLT